MATTYVGTAVFQSAIVVPSPADPATAASVNAKAFRYLQDSAQYFKQLLHGEGALPNGLFVTGNLNMGGVLEVGDNIISQGLVYAQSGFQADGQSYLNGIENIGPLEQRGNTVFTGASRTFTVASGVSANWYGPLHVQSFMNLGGRGQIIPRTFRGPDANFTIHPVDHTHVFVLAGDLTANRVYQIPEAGTFNGQYIVVTNADPNFWIDVDTQVSGVYNTQARLTGENVVPSGLYRTIVVRRLGGTWVTEHRTH